VRVTGTDSGLKGGYQVKIERITEVGVAVRNLDKAVRLMVEMLGAEASEIVTVEMYNMRFCMCRVGQVDFELMEPIDGQGVIADFLKKRGQGLHHVAFAVENLDQGMQGLKEKGVRFVSEQPLTIQGHGRDMAGNEISGEGNFTFSIPSSLLGVLFEFIEYPAGYHHS